MPLPLMSTNTALPSVAVAVAERKHRMKAAGYHSSPDKTSIYKVTAFQKITFLRASHGLFLNVARWTLYEQLSH